MNGMGEGMMWGMGHHLAHGAVAALVKYLRAGD